MQCCSFLGVFMPDNEKAYLLPEILNRFGCGIDGSFSKTDSQGRVFPSADVRPQPTTFRLYRWKRGSLGSPFFCTTELSSKALDLSHLRITLQELRRTICKNVYRSHYLVISYSLSWSWLEGLRWRGHWWSPVAIAHHCPQVTVLL